MYFDIIIRNGSIIDGTGRDSYKADIAILGDKIVDIGVIKGASKKEINAKNLIITPGFIDIHTHYDGQSVWDNYLKPSSLHGVTTVIMGNCGVGFAPCKKDDREKLIELMEGVEDIPSPVMHEGLNWDWETFPEYLDALDKNNRDIDVCALIPHAALRVFVMGKRAINHERATEEDMIQMRKISADAIKSGAFGFSTSRTISHKSCDGEFTPTLRAHESELMAIAKGLKDANGGFMEIVSDWNEPSPEEEFAVLRKIAKSTNIPIVFTCNQRHDRTEYWKDLMRLAREAKNDNLSIRPVVAPRPIGILLGLNGSQNPFSGTPTYKKIAHLSLKERVNIMKGEKIRNSILDEDPIKDSKFPLINRISYKQMYEFGTEGNYAPDKNESLAIRSIKEKITAQELAYNILIKDEGKAFIYSPLVNFASNNLDACEAMLIDKNAIMGLGDGGAHVGFILDAGFPTWLIDYWCNKKNKFSKEETIRRLTTDTAMAAGLHDRGKIKKGFKADINILDWKNVGAGHPYIVNDLPAGGKRLMQETTGFEYTIVSGNITYIKGKPTGNLPGTLVRRS
ncbi:MAG: amidohydrolase family protein [Pelagibacterales bacterium]|nr:amidohydrolase family protein [Pelagibacterales bacterium]